MSTVLVTAPYMIPSLDRFKFVFEKHRIDLIIPEVRERMDEAGLLKYAGQFDGTICGDDRYTERVLEACAPRLKIISKWGTGIDSIDSECRIPTRNQCGAYAQCLYHSRSGYRSRLYAGFCAPPAMDGPAI